MRDRHPWAVAVLSPLWLLSSAGAGQPRADVEAAEVRAAVELVYPQVEGLYMDLHRNPELSGQERATAARLAKELRPLGFEVTTGVGGPGVVARLVNGVGPTVMLRAELDGLPVEEKTGLPYASRAKRR